MLETHLKITVVPHITMKTNVSHWQKGNRKAVIGCTGIRKTLDKCPFTVSCKECIHELHFSSKTFTYVS